jgi:hypothetical protein
MNQARWDGRLRLLPCVVCVALERADPNPACELHHLGDPNTGERHEKAKVPLCDDHHQGENGIHKLRRRAWVAKHGLSDLRLLTIAVDLVVRDLP